MVCAHNYDSGFKESDSDDTENVYRKDIFRIRHF